MSTSSLNSSSRILIADDSSQWRYVVRKLLAARPEWQIIGEACNGLEAIRKAAELRPDLVLLDIRMPGMNGVEAAKRIREAMPVSKIVFLTQDNDTDLRSAALNTGPEGYVVKANAATELFSTIATALNGAQRCTR